MSEAIISRRGYTAEGKPELRTEVITGNINWTVPEKIRNTTISVLIFGGGGSKDTHYTGYYTAGGSGWMNNGEIQVVPGQSIPITIGMPGNTNGSSGGTTTFGSYLSANGGFSGSYIGGSGGAGGVPQGSGYQFGGAGGEFYSNYSRGGDGGIWGGGGGAGGSISNANGGNGGMYGGGGGGGGYYNSYTSISSRYFCRGGNGGMYGGGGGTGFGVNASFDGIKNTVVGSSNFGIGGEYGGNGGRYDTLAEDGINTIGNESVPESLQGNGKSRSDVIRYIKCTNLPSDHTYPDNMIIRCDGGGGFGGCGGYGLVGIQGYTFNGNHQYYALIAIGGGGGGGYGGNGGNGGYNRMDSYQPPEPGAGGGGGGGYGSNGGNGVSYGGGGGGYFSDGTSGGGGWYNYCHGGSYDSVQRYGYGSGAPTGNSSAAMQGACIIQYWI